MLINVVQSNYTSNQTSFMRSVSDTVCSLNGCTNCVLQLMKVHVWCTCTNIDTLCRYTGMLLKFIHSRLYMHIHCVLFDMLICTHIVYIVTVLSRNWEGAYSKPFLAKSF